MRSRRLGRRFGGAGGQGGFANSSSIPAFSEGGVGGLGDDAGVGTGGGDG
jgi:hypothetical protein